MIYTDCDNCGDVWLTEDLIDCSGRMLCVDCYHDADYEELADEVRRQCEGDCAAYADDFDWVCE